jgi:hypothetical protein
MFPDTPTRVKIDLSGSWRYSIDGKEWNSVSIPGVYEGPARVTFMRSFSVTSEMIDKYAFYLVVYGINYQCEITMNGNFVGRHQGGYSSVVMPIQPNTLQVGGDNSIVVTVDNELTPNTTLPLRQQVGGWRTYGGISRDLYILAVPKLHIERADVKCTITGEGTSALLAVSADVIDRWSGMARDGSSTLGLQVEIYDKLKSEFVGRSNIVAVNPEMNKIVSSRVDLKLDSPKLWSPDVPDLYTLKVQLVRIANKTETTILDEFDFDTGLRVIQWKEGRLYLNNALTPLKGMIWVEDHPSFGSALNYEALERDVALMKSTGTNVIRFPYPPHPYMLNLCDRYGIFVLEDIPLVNVPSTILAKDYFQDLAVTYIREMIARDRTHSSVLGWGIGENFEAGSTAGCEYVVNAKNIIKSLDDRIVYYTTASATDKCLENIDVIGISAMQEDPRQLKEFLHSCQTQYPHKPIIVTRFGQNIEPDNRRGYSDSRSLESQARYIMRFYEIMHDEKIAGSVVSAFSDWRTDRPAMTTNSPDAYMQTMGIVSYEREKRVAFDVVRSLFNNEKVQALPVGNYSASTPIIYVIAGLVILVSLAFAYNANRRFRDSIHRSLFRTYNFFADVRDQRILTYPQSVFLMLVVALTWGTILSAVFSHYRHDLLLDNILSQFMSDSLKNWFVHLVWSPLQFILVVSALVIIKIVLITCIVMLFSMTVRTYVYFYHALSITAWSMLPFIVLIPVAMILYRLMDTEFYILPVAVLVVIVTLWVFIRLLKGISIIYDVYPMRVYAGGIIFLLIFLGALYGYLDYTQSTSVYLKFLLHTLKV